MVRSLEPLRVLVIDDEEDMREIARFALELEPRLRVETCASGADGIDRARIAAPDVILLDWMMPEMDGPSVLRALSADEATRRIPVVFLTGRAHGAHYAELIRLGARGAIAKPFDPMTLGKQLLDLLGTKAS